MSWWKLRAVLWGSKMSEYDGSCFGFFSSHKEVKEYLEERLQNGWCVFQGNASTIQALEEIIYTPNTEENKNFEIVGFNPSLIIGKKTAKLKVLLGHPPEFKDIVIVSFEEKLQNSRIPVRFVWPEDATAIPQISNDLAKQLFPDDSADAAGGEISHCGAETSLPLGRTN